ncbi:transporter substrate-binding domain-containing protein [Pararhizobium haloflavum]|uniref:transporter substrate-binding domain-containing protein n=1 Tax=Pararhizobium haloflavum TaxID=2037914 RepID=UPI00352261FC
MKQMALAAAGLAVSALALGAPAMADDLAAVKEAGELRIASSGAYPPFSLVNDQNEVVGFDVSIGKAIAERMGVEPVVTTTAWDGIIAGLLANKYDTIIGSMSITPEREKAVDFVGPYYHAGRAIFVTEDSDVETLEDLQDATIGVTLGETHEKWAREQSDMGWDLRTYKGLPELLLELENGRIEAMVIDSIPGRVAITKEGRPIRELELPDLEGGSVEVGIAIRKDNPELKAAMQEALDAIMEDGTYEDIAMEWVGADIR